MKRRLALILGAALVLSGASAAQAVTGPWVASEYVSARLMSATTATGDLASVPLGIEVKLDDGWKTYWRSPGDAGLPPVLDWAGSANFATATLLYPKPERLTLLGIQTFGYKHDVIFPVDVKPAKPGDALALKLKLDILVCAKLCIPKTFALALTVPAGPAMPDAEAQTLAKARAAVPGGERTVGLALESVEEVSDKGVPALEVKATAEEAFRTPDVIAEVDPAVALGQPRVTLDGDGRGATFVVPLTQKLPVGAKLAGRKVVLTLIDGDRALETPVTTITQGTSAAEEDPGPSLLTMLGVALLGGLILNLMPCVLPVLSLKFISVVGQGGRAPGKVRAGFLATAAGVIVSFLAIALALIAVKAAGRTIGWGIQFQEPAFIAGMAVLVTIFACHLAGLFEVPLPRFVRAAASSRTAPDESLAGHFVTGAFATLLATPCSAPFLGTAVGFALAGAPLQMLGIFAALGVGLASPYLVIAAVPQLAAKMPRPGRWMLILKQAMAIPLVATAVWLLSILSTQVGPPVAFGVAVLLAVVAGLLVWRDKLPPARRGLVFPIVLVLALATIVLPDLLAARGIGQTRDGADTIAWTAFDRGKIRSLVSQGKTVFVDVTADWCLTCQANKKLVLSKDATAARLNSQAIAMQADWTRPNAEIAAYLATYGRYGIPFNVVYGPMAPAGIVLPELLSTGAVDDALDKASGIKASALDDKPVADR
jgi:suppressor for copper-sensitivity B